ncbi:regulatory protein RecX [Lachnospiraceae bacterium KM106-2]|nr:regulatory protein RecX [Lachnospiraceae bacterium KM106-2]
MEVTAIVKVDNKKSKVYIDGEYAFVLYIGDFRKYKLKEGDPIEESVYQEILVDTIYRRAKQKAMAILKRMDRTESELRKKLEQDLYRKDAVDLAIDYVKSYHYIDDERFAKNFVHYKKNSKSKREIQYALSLKGISKELIEEAMEEEYESEETAIKKLIQKKCTNVEELAPEKKTKLINYLCRKGYSYEKIKYCLNHFDEF